MAIDEVSEISELHRLYDIQLQAYRDNPYPSYEERIENLRKLKKLLLDNQEDLIK